MPPFEAASESFRTKFVLNEGYGYGGEAVDSRDMDLVGHARPRLFAKEPSAVSAAFVIAVFVWYPLSTSKRKRIYLATSIPCAMLLSGSPIILGSVIVYFVADSNINRQLLPGDTKIYSSKLPRILGVSVATILFLAIGWSLFGHRLGSNERGVDGSTSMRLIFPYKIAFMELPKHPILGIGLGQIETIEQDILKAVARDPSIDLATLPQMNRIFCNIMADILIDFGIIGTIVFIWLIYLVIKHFGSAHYRFIFTCMFFVCNTQGGLVCPEIWMRLMILSVVACKLQYRSPY